MRTEADKAGHEEKVFREFASRVTRLRLDPGSIEKRSPPEPDILCRDADQGFIAFELVELCDPNLAAEITRITKSGDTDPAAIWTSDPSGMVFTKKLSRRYQTDHPVELLCYTAGRIVTPDDGIIAELQHLAVAVAQSPFRRIWLLGDDCHLAYERPDAFDQVVENPVS